jgi:hypothetical protein
LSALHRLIDPIRAREAEGGPHRDDWRSLRGSVHQMLALRHSRVALYDLRETIEAADGPLPGSFLAAARLVGDVSCLEALAGALGRADPGDARWRAQLTDAFRALAARERLTRRHAVMKRIATRWPEVLAGWR